MLHIGWMNSRTSNRVRGTTWAFAALALILFCWLGLLTFKVGPIFNGLESRLRIDTRLVLAYGPLGLPLFGVVAAGGVILSDLFLPFRWIPTVLTILCIGVAIMAFRALTVPICVMTPTHQ